jgi:hypothetical protein
VVEGGQVKVKVKVNQSSWASHGWWWWWSQWCGVVRWVQRCGEACRGHIGKVWGLGRLKAAAGAPLLTRARMTRRSDAWCVILNA